MQTLEVAMRRDDCQPLRIDIAHNRAQSKYSRGELLKRVGWMICQPLFRFSPRTAFGWRRWLLRIFGADIGLHVHIYNSAVIYMPWNLSIGDWSSIGEHVYIYNLGKIHIGAEASISYRAHLCAGTHDYRRADLPLVKPAVEIGSRAWVCTDAFVGPGMTVGEGAVVGARSVVTKNVPAWQIVAGNPARIIKRRELLPAASLGS